MAPKLISELCGKGLDGEVFTKMCFRGGTVLLLLKGLAMESIWLGRENRNQAGFRGLSPLNGDILRGSEKCLGGGDTGAFFSRNRNRTEKTYEGAKKQEEGFRYFHYQSSRKLLRGESKPEHIDRETQRYLRGYDVRGC